MKVTLTRSERFKDARTVHNRFGDQSMAAVAAAANVDKGKIQALEKEGSDRGVDYREVAKLAAHYGVSADWLMGLSEYRTSNVDTKALCQRTGLSEDAIANLINEAKDPRALHAWNLILGAPDTERLHRFTLAADRLLCFHENRAKIHRNSKSLLEYVPVEKREEFKGYIQQWGGEMIDPDEAASVYAHEVEEALGLLLHGAAKKLPPSDREAKSAPQVTLI